MFIYGVLMIFNLQNMDTPIRLVNHEEWQAQEGLQTEVLTRSEDELLVGGARGSGKTELGLAWGCEPEYINNPRFSGIVIRKDYEDLSDWITRARYFYYGLGTIVGKPAEIRWNAGGVTRLGHWKDKQTLGKYIGHEYHKMNIEELTQSMSSLDEYISLMGSLRSSVDGLRPQLFASTNPGGIGYKWVKEYYVDVCTNKPYCDPKTGRLRLFIPMTIEDNPLLISRDPAYYNWLKGLPEPLRSMWYKGSWKHYTGQFFPEFGTHLAKDPWVIGKKAGLGLYGSLDVGIGHNTSFGLWYKSPDGSLERLMSYFGNGMHHKWHAQRIYEKIEAFSDYVGGCFPIIIYHGHDANRRERLNEQTVRRPIDEYIDVFRNKETKFVAMNPDKAYGCSQMHLVFSDDEGEPILRYWRKYNQSFEIGIMNAQTDINNPDVYVKNKRPGNNQEGGNVIDDSIMQQFNKESAVDDACDEAMYGVVGIYGTIANDMQKRMLGVDHKVTPINVNDYAYNNYGSYFKETSLS